MPGLDPGIHAVLSQRAERQWNGLPEPVPGLDPGVKPGNDEDQDGKGASLTQALGRQGKPVAKHLL